MRTPTPAKDLEANATGLIRFTIASALGKVSLQMVVGNNHLQAISLAVHPGDNLCRRHGDDHLRASLPLSQQFRAEAITSSNRLGTR